MPKSAEAVTPERRGPTYGMVAIAVPLLGSLVGAIYAQRPHRHESAEENLGHLFEWSGIFLLGFAAAAVLLGVGFIRREKYRWLALLFILLDWPMGVMLANLVFWYAR